MIGSVKLLTVETYFKNGNVRHLGALKWDDSKLSSVLKIVFLTFIFVLKFVIC